MLRRTSYLPTIFEVFRLESNTKFLIAEANQPVQWILVGRAAIIHQGNTIWVGLPSSVLDCRDMSQVKLCETYRHVCWAS